MPQSFPFSITGSRRTCRAPIILAAIPASVSLTVPQDVDYIGERAFYGAPIQALTIFEGLTTLGNEAFGNCTMLTSVTLPNSLVNFEGTGCSPFRNCSSLEEVNLPITVDYTKPLFESCNALTTFNFTKGTDGIGEDYDSFYNALMDAVGTGILVRSLVKERKHLTCGDVYCT